MQVFERKADLNKFVNSIKSAGKSIGFVPTMGALHAGHIALISAAVKKCDVIIASVFVNPIQFNNPEDLKKYPRTFEEDRKKLEESGCNAVFYPSVEEMYPEKVSEHYDFGPLEKVMEGATRPGHFNGVAIVVKRLFDLVRPDMAFFGKKDFQQLAIIKALVKQTSIPVQIIGMDTVREKDGLAMSSRNMLLSVHEREIAVQLSETLNYIKANKGVLEPEALENEAKKRLKQNFKVDYIQIVNGHSLQAITSWDETDYPVVCVAAFIGGVRLIDNLEL